MQRKCPKCGFTEDVANLNIGDKVQCPCGHEYAAGVFDIDLNLFLDGQAMFACPYCGTSLAIPEEAIGRNVRCSECEEKFKIVKRQQAKDDTAVQIENVSRIGKPLNRKSTSPILEEVAKIIKFFASIVAIVMASICIGFLAWMTCIGLDINFTDSGMPLDSSLPRLPMYIDKFQNGKTYYYPHHDFCPLKVAGVIKREYFWSRGPEGIIAARINPDYSHTAIFIEMKPDGFVDFEELPSMNLKAEGIFYYTAATGGRAAIKRFKRVDRH